MEGIHRWPHALVESGYKYNFPAALLVVVRLVLQKEPRGRQNFICINRRNSIICIKVLYEAKANCIYYLERVHTCISHMYVTCAYIFHIFMYIRMYVCMYACIYMYVCMHAYICICVYTYVCMITVSRLCNDDLVIIET